MSKQIEVVNATEKSTNVTLVESNPQLNLVDPARVRKRAPDDLVELAQQIQNANVQVKNNACGKLMVIAEQIRFLQQQAMKILEEADLNKDLHQAACNFKKVPGHIYHLYKKPSGQTYFSMLSPSEWGEGLKDEYLNSYRLEYDQSWTEVGKIQAQEHDRRWAENILNPSKRGNILAIDQTTD